MEEHKIEEKDYLLNISEVIVPRRNPFIIGVENDMVLSVMDFDPPSSVQKMCTLTSYKTLYDTVIDLVFKISFALRNAIEDTYSDEVQNEFSLIYTGGPREWSAYYNIENALFRIEALWDILAQIYNIKYGLEKDIKDVYHNRIFSTQERWRKKYWKSGMPSDIKSIADYFLEEDDIGVTDGVWKGNYSYVNSLRNDMTHKFSISRSAISNYVFELKSHPTYILRRVAECFSQLQSFICLACDNILEEDKI